MSFPKVETKVIFLRATYGTFSSGSEKKGNYVDHGQFFEAKLAGIKAIPQKDDFKPHWQLTFRSKEGSYVLSLPMSSSKAAHFFNALASVDDFEKPIKLNVWQGKPFKENQKPPTRISIREGLWEDYSSNYRGKYPYLKQDESPMEGQIYFPWPDRLPDGNGGFLTDNEGNVIKKWNNVNRFIQEKIVDMVNEKIGSIVPGEDYLETEDDLPQSVSSTPTVEASKETAPPAHIPPVEELQEELKFKIDDDDLPF